MSRKIYWGHQGLGDHLLCNGLYRTLADQGPIIVACIESVARNVQHMLSDVPNIEVQVWPNEDVMNQKLKGTPGLLRIGSQATEIYHWIEHCHHRFDQVFYEQHGVPFENRWSRWCVPNCPQVRHPEGRGGLFIHRKANESWYVEPDGKGLITPMRDTPIFEYIAAIKEADEIHCSNSCFASLADSYDLSGKRLYFYLDGRSFPKHRNKWSYLNGR